MYDELIAYFEAQYELTSHDLLLDDDDRMILVGELNMLDKLREINERGFPQDQDEETE